MLFIPLGVCRKKDAQMAATPHSHVHARSRWFPSATAFPLDDGVGYWGIEDLARLLSEESRCEWLLDERFAWLQKLLP